MLAFFIAFLVMIVGGLALDASQAWRVHAILQAASDAAAHDGATKLSQPVAFGVDVNINARMAAEANARGSLGNTHLSDALHSSSVDVGWLDPDTRVFTANSLPANAVRVRLDRRDRLGNPEPTYLLHFVGLNHWNIGGDSIATFYSTPSMECIDPLLTLKSRVDVEAQDVFLGICLAASAQSVYGNGLEWKNAETDGLIDGLIAESLGLSQSLVTDTLDELAGGGAGGAWPSRNLAYALADAADTAMTVLHAADFDVSQLRPGEGYRILCDDLAVIRIPSGSVLDGVAVYSDCPIKFGPQVTVRSSLIVSNLKAVFTGLGPISVTPDISVGRTDVCSPGDGVRIYLFMDVEASQTIPALYDTSSPIGEFIEDTYGTAGGVLGGTLNTLGAMTAELAETISVRTEALGLADVCVAPEVMLDAETIALR